MATKTIRLDTGEWDGSVHPAAHEKLRKVIRNQRAVLLKYETARSTYTTWCLSDDKSATEGPHGHCYAQLPWSTKRYLFLPLCPRYSGLGGDSSYNFIRDTFYDAVILNPDGPFKTILEGTDVIKVTSAVPADIIYTVKDPEETIIGIIVDPTRITELVGPLGLKFFLYAFRFCWEVQAWSSKSSWLKGITHTPFEAYKGLVEAGLSPVRAWLVSGYTASGSRHGGHSPLMDDPSVEWLRAFFNSHFIKNQLGTKSNMCFQKGFNNYIPEDLRKDSDKNSLSFSSITQLMSKTSVLATSWGTLAVLVNEAFDSILDTPETVPDPDEPKMPTIKVGNHVRFIRFVSQKHRGFEAGGENMSEIIKKFISSGRVHEVTTVNEQGVQLSDKFGNGASYYYYSPWSFEIVTEPISLPPMPKEFEWLEASNGQALLARKDQTFGWKNSLDLLIGRQVTLRDITFSYGRPYSARVNNIDWNLPIECFAPVPDLVPTKPTRKPRTKKAAA